MRTWDATAFGCPDEGVFSLELLAKGTLPSFRSDLINFS
jgi:hypothetical protein